MIIRLKVDEEKFEVGKDDVEHISIDKEHDLIKIGYNNTDEEIHYMFIPIHSVRSIDVVEKRIDINPFVVSVR